MYFDSSAKVEIVQISKTRVDTENRFHCTIFSGAERYLLSRLEGCHRWSQNPAFSDQLHLARCNGSCRSAYYSIRVQTRQFLSRAEHFPAHVAWPDRVVGGIRSREA